MSGFFGGEFGDNVADVVMTAVSVAPPITRGKYRDWRGDLYDVMHVVRDVHEGKWMVLYRSLIDVNQPMMVLDYATFFGTVDTGGYRPVARYVHVTDSSHRSTSPIPPPLPRSTGTAANQPRTETNGGGSARSAGRTEAGAQAAGSTGQATGASGYVGASPAVPVAPTVSAIPPVENRVRRPAPRAPASKGFLSLQARLAVQPAATKGNEATAPVQGETQG